MGKYLIELEPMSSYFFGGERTFGFGRETGQKQPYYIASESVPSQPTLFGTLRYIVLANNDALINQSNSSKADSLVGVESFSIKKARKEDYVIEVQKAAKESPDTHTFQSNHMQIKKLYDQSFGVINCISPLFLVRNGTWYVRTPNDHKPKSDKKNNEKYTPFLMKESSVRFSNGSKIYPSDYKAKEGYGGGYISLDDLSIVSDDKIFLSDLKTGINSHRTEDVSGGINDDDSFFKKERKMLAKDFKFAFIADVRSSLDPGKMVVFMGQDKSPFLCTISETNDDLITKTKCAFSGCHNIVVKYALSDVMPVESIFPGSVQTDYYIADTKILRNLESNMRADQYYDRLKKSEKLYKIIRAGSVFYTEHDILKCIALETIGMNILINI